MEPASLNKRYRDLQRYVGWTAEDARRVRFAFALLEPHFGGLVDDFYAEIRRHPDANRVISDGDQQIQRLKKTLRQWLGEIFTSEYDEEFVVRRWHVGRKHVDIGLDQVFTNVALSRLRCGLIAALADQWSGEHAELMNTIQSLNRILDLDLAVIEDAYQAEYVTRLQRSERLITIGQMGGGLAHELRNPLNVIKTSVYYLLHAQSLTPEKNVEHLERIQRQVGLADGVITALSDFAKLPLPVFEPLDLPPFFVDVLSVASLPETIVVSVVCPDSVAAVLGDPRQLQVVFLNLLRNARDAMPGGGRITIRAQEATDNVEITVEDTGEGIAPDDLRRVMDPLFSTKARGIGLGLSITKAIVENHRGGIRVSSRQGQGSQFTVVLPAAPA